VNELGVLRHRLVRIAAEKGEEKENGQSLVRLTAKL
jgi:hypothetical protein